MKICGRKNLEIYDSAAITISEGSEVAITIRPRKDAMITLRIGRNCRVSTFVLQEQDVSVEQTNHVGEGSIVRSSGLWLGSGTAKITNILEGKKAEAYDVNIFVEKGDSSLHLNSVLKHAERNTRGNILIKGIAKDRATAKLGGMIRVEKNGAGAQSFLSEHVLLLSPQAHAVARPELEIKNNDVSSRHSASVAPLGEEKIFYLMSRGLARDEAERLMAEGFLASAIDKIGDEGMRGEIAYKALSAL